MIARLFKRLGLLPSLPRLRRTGRCARNDAGQAAIEFLAVILVVFFFLFFLLSLAMLFILSDYIEYSTFMAARTYKSSFGTQEAQERNARDVFNLYTGKIQGMVRNLRLDFVQLDPNDPQTSGATATYELDLFYLPPIFLGSNQPVSRIPLKTETYLGRDPSYNECFQFFEQFTRRLGLGIEGTGYVGGMEDNGC